jgi:hypothetical protein
VLERNIFMKTRFSALLLSCCCAFFCSLFAQEKEHDTIAPKIEIIGKAAIEEGQFVKSSYTYLPNGSTTAGYERETMPFRPWINNELAEIGLKTTLNSHFSAIVSPQIKLWNDTWDWRTMGENGSAANPFIQHMTVSLADAEGIVGFGNKETFAFNAMVGVMPYKYNEDAKNLGEYLFRTGEHPAYIETSFDYPYATLTGLRLNAQMFNDLSLDVLFSQETRIIPLNDWSLSLLARYKMRLNFSQYNALDIGAGVMFDRVLPVSGSLDNPVFSGGAQDTFFTSSGTVQSLKWGGTKVMARVSFDPKGFLPTGVSGIFGKEDGKIYAEAAILGLNTFTAYKKAIDSQGNTIYVVDSLMNFYSDITQRIPVMFGFNVPTFKLLDYLSVEVEWFGWPYSPSLYNYQNLVYTLPQPIIPNVSTSNGSSRSLYTKDNAWKYSFNFRKTIWGHFSAIGQIARDHTRHDVYYSEFADPEEAFLQKDEWGWWLKLQYSL